MYPYSQLELGKNIDMNEVRKWSAAACYAAKPKQPLCMISASGEQICLPENQYYIDGASAILGNKTQPSTCMRSVIEPFAEQEQGVEHVMERCIDGSYSINCARPIAKS